MLELITQVQTLFTKLFTGIVDKFFLPRQGSGLDATHDSEVHCCVVFNRVSQRKRAEKYGSGVCVRVVFVACLHNQRAVLIHCGFVGLVRLLQSESRIYESEF